MLRPIHFEIHSQDPEKHSRFYAEVFGWKFEKWDGPSPYWLTTTGEQETPGINGGMMIRQGEAPKAGQGVNGYVCTMDVPNIDQWIEKVKQAGGDIAVPKMAIPGMAWICYAHDLDGNIFGMFQEDKSAS
jgi:predicted enzyme related to lactoylglutathione lyase